MITFTPKKMSTEKLRRTTEQITGLADKAWLQIFLSGAWASARWEK